MSKNISRRSFLTALSTGAAAAATAGVIRPLEEVTALASRHRKPAILGGTPVAPDKVWPKWPAITEEMIRNITDTARTGKWCRKDAKGGNVDQFEEAFARMLDAKGCVCFITNNTYGPGIGQNGGHTSARQLKWPLPFHMVYWGKRGKLMSKT